MRRRGERTKVRRGKRASLIEEAAQAREEAGEAQQELRGITAEKAKRHLRTLRLLGCWLIRSVLVPCSRPLREETGKRW